MIRIVLLGFGNLGYSLCNSLYNNDYTSIVQVYNKSKLTLSGPLKDLLFTTNLDELKPADIYIIAIPDDVIGTFSEDLPLKNQLVVHTSGGVAMDILSKKNRKGVFYPLQTFSKSRDTDFKKIPICIEASKDTDLSLLRKLGEALSENVIEINSEKRKILHLAAVFVNNFVNHMYTIGQEILQNEELPFQLLQPLIFETARKIEDLSPLNAQTGPAKRNDKNTIEKHLHLLAEGPYKELYQLLTQSIQATHGKKL
jgi:predicted short-subunit dehydrogenase-like oxidoreductase (DUF2520 family)